MSTRSTRIALAGMVTTAALLLTACGGSDDGPGNTKEGGEGNGDSAAQLINDGTLVVAMSGEFQPFSYFEGNTLTGFDYDIGKAVADELGLKMQGKTGAFDTLIGGLKANRYDVLIASMTPTEERAKQVDFTDGYYTDGAQAFVAKGSDCTDITKMDKPSLGVAAGTTYLDWLNKNGGDWAGEKRTFTSDITALKDVGTGRLDAAVTGRLVGLYQINQAGLNLEACGEPLYTEEPAFAVKKENTGLKDDLNEALATIKDDGTYAKISEKYFGQDISSTNDGDDSAATS